MLSPFIRNSQGSVNIGVRLEGPQFVGKCDSSFTLDASRSQNNNNRPFTYKWSVTADASIDVFNLTSLLYENVQPIIEIKANLLNFNVQYIFTVTVTDVTGRSENSSLAIVHQDDYLPSVTLPPKLLYLWSRPFIMIKPNVMWCGTNNVSYLWTQTSGPSLIVQPVMTQRVLHLSNANFAGEGSYDFTLTVRSDKGNTASATISLIVKLDPIQAIISGGTSRLLSNSEKSITLDGTSSSDPANFGTASYLWNCTQIIQRTGNNTLCPDQLHNYIQSHSQDPIVTIPFTIPDGIYLFTLTFTKGNRVSVTSQRIRTASGVRPIVYLDGLPPTVNADDKVAMYGSYFMRNMVRFFNMKNLLVVERFFNHNILVERYRW